MERWDVIQAVQRMQDYIDEHLTEVITLTQLAKAAGYSPWHSARIFKELIHRTPFEYIRALRLSKAALVLRDERSKVVDVALDFVFDSHEGFTRAFTKQFGLSPRKYSQNAPPIQLFIPYHVRDSYPTFPKGGKTMSEKQTATKTVFVQVMERPQRKVLLKRGITAEEYFTYCGEAGTEVWGVLTSVKEALYEPIGMWLPQHLIPKGTSKYVQGVELPVHYDGLIPEGFELIELPPCTMMVFQGEPFEEGQFREATGELWEKIKHFQPELYGFEWADEEAPRFQLSPMEYRGYIEARPVRSLNPRNKS